MLNVARGHTIIVTIRSACGMRQLNVASVIAPCSLTLRLVVGAGAQCQYFHRSGDLAPINHLIAIRPGFTSRSCTQTAPIYRAQTTASVHFCRRRLRNSGVCLSASNRPVTRLGPDLQNILRQSYDYLTIMPKLRSTYDGRLIYKTSYEGRKVFLRYDSLAKL